MKLNAKELRELEEEHVQGKLREVKRQPLYFILENIYDTYNIGGLFRLADALAVSKMYLCGTCEIPPNSRIKKASIGTYKVVPWEYKKSAKEAIEDLHNLESRIHSSESKKQKILNSEFNSEFYNLNSKLSVVAIEQHQDAINFTDSVWGYGYIIFFAKGSESGNKISQLIGQI